MIRFLIVLFFSLDFVGFSVVSAKAETLLETIESPYNTIFVYKKAPYITLAFGHKNRRYIESRRNPDDLTELPIAYTQSFTIGLAYPKQLRSSLMIGMGGGSTSWYLHQAIPDLQISAVELDFEIVRLAKKYYGLDKSDRFKIFTMDGRVHLLRNKARHDIIFIDAYRGPFVPFHLMTKEFFRLAKKRLQEGGVVVQNIEPSTMLYDRTIATLADVFDQVEVYRAGGNVVAVAYDGPAKTIKDLLARAQQIQSQYKFRYSIPDLIEERAMLLDYDTKQPALTDDFAPVNTLKEIKSHNKKRKP